ncbi:unnamed protein product [Closterium sp. Yama58-4]|nr:unnamed protein product [Closterium sp. Yama58-4]
MSPFPYSCGFLLGSPDFRMGAADFFKHLAARRSPSDDQEAFNAAMTSVADSLVSAADASLDRITASTGSAPASSPREAAGQPGGMAAGGGARGGGGAGEVDEGEVAFAERLCEAMVAFAPSNLKRAAQQDDSRYAKFFHTMLRFFECKCFSLHALALQLWLVLLRESAQSTSGGKDNKRASVILVPPDFCLRLLDVVADHLPRRPGEGEDGEDEDGGWQEEFTNSGDYAQYRSRLMDVVRLVTQQQPLIAVSKVVPGDGRAWHSNPSPPSSLPPSDGRGASGDTAATAHSSIKGGFSGWELDVLRLVTQQHPLIAVSKGHGLHSPFTLPPLCPPSHPPFSILQMDVVRLVTQQQPFIAVSKVASRDGRWGGMAN